MLHLYDPASGYSTGVWRENNAEGNQCGGPKISITTFVTGPNRCKFFKRPMTPPSQAKESNMPDSSLYVGYLIQPGLLSYSTIGTQTDYRESESQTEPWDPPYALHKICSDPEIITISELKYGSGLPVTPGEVEILTRARDKKKWELSLPPLYCDVKDWKKRQSMIAEKENKEWQYKMQKMEERQNSQLQQIETCLAEQLHAYEQKNLILLEKLSDEKISNCTFRRLKSRSKMSQNMQRLGKKHIIFSRRNNLDATSVIFKEDPLTQNEVRRKKLNEEINSVASSFYLTNPNGLKQLEEWLLEEGDMSMNPEIYLPKKDPQHSRYEKLLQGAHEDILGGKSEKLPITPPEIKVQTERRKLRIPTPTVTPVSQDFLDKDCSALLLQNAIRGRALQKEVLEGTQRNFDLIGELQFSHATNEEDAVIIENKKKNYLSFYKQQKNKADELAMFNEVLAELVGKATSELLNILGKEVSRHQEYKRVQDVIYKAKQDRTVREAEESGHRQQELNSRQVLEDLLHQKLEDQKDTVINFLENIIIDVTTKDEIQKSKRTQVLDTII